MRKNKSMIVSIILVFIILVGSKVYAGYNGWLNFTWQSLNTGSEIYVYRNSIKKFEENGVQLKPMANSKPVIVAGNELSSSETEMCFLANDNPSVTYENVGVKNELYQANEVIDLRLSISNPIFPDNPTDDKPGMICIKNNSIGFTIHELKQVDWKIEYFKSGTNEPISIDTTQKFTNIDNGKYIGSKELRLNYYKPQNDTTLKYYKNEDTIFFTNDTNTNTEPVENPTGKETTLVREFRNSSTEGVLGTQFDDLSKTELDLNLRIYSFSEYISIDKSVEDENKDNIVQPGEKVTYSIDLTSEEIGEPLRRNYGGNFVVFNVPVRDDLLENIPDYYTFNNDVKIYGTYNGDTTEVTKFTGDLTKGDFLISEYPTGYTYKIVFSFTASNTIKLPSGDIVNKATDNGNDPSLCDMRSKNCAIASILAKPETTIKKSVTDENNDNIVQANETLKYQIELENTNLIRPVFDTYTEEVVIPAPMPNSKIQTKTTDGILYNVPVRDNLIEAKLEYLKYNNDIKVYDITSGTKVEITDYSGSLKDGTFVINKMPAGSKFVLEFSFKASNNIGELVSRVTNKATDDKSNPKDCTSNSKDCAIVSNLVEPETIIRKSVSDASANNILEQSEVLTYQIEVENKSIALDKSNVKVRDNLIETTPKYLLFNNDVKVYDITSGTKVEITDYTGSLKDGTFVINKIPARSVYMLEFSFKASSTTKLPVNNIVNKATDNGSNPTECNSNSKNCAIAEIKPKIESGSGDDSITIRSTRKARTIENVNRPAKTIVLPRTGTDINNLYYVIVASTTLLFLRKKIAK